MDIHSTSPMDRIGQTPSQLIYMGRTTGTKASGWNEDFIATSVKEFLPINIAVTVSRVAFAPCRLDTPRCPYPLANPRHLGAGPVDTSLGSAGQQHISRCIRWPRGHRPRSDLARCHTSYLSFVSDLLYARDIECAFTQYSFAPSFGPWIMKS